MLVACMGAQPTKSKGKPDWIVNEPSKSGHVYGVGSAEIYTDEAEALRRAQDAARVTMIQKLKVTVTGSFSQNTEETRATGQQTQLVRTVKNTIGSQIPRAELSDVDVVDSYADTQKGVVYTLVHLDRVKATAKLRRQINELDMQITERSDKTSEHLPTLQQLQSLLPALKWVAKRDKLVEQAALVDPQGRHIVKDDYLKAVEARIEKLLDTLVVTVKAENQEARGIRSGLVESLTKTGLRVSQDSGDLNLTYAATLRPVEKAGRFYVFAGGRVTIKEAGGRVLSEFSKEAKGVSAVSMELAQDKAIQNLASVLGDELAASLVDKID